MTMTNTQAERILPQDTCAALLGRSLTTLETENYGLYLSIATERLEDILCVTLTLPLTATMQLLLARLVDVSSAEMSENITDAKSYGLASKKVENFSLTYGNSRNAETESPLEGFIHKNRDLLIKLCKCAGSVIQGEKHDVGHSIRRI